MSQFSFLCDTSPVHSKASRHSNRPRSRSDAYGIVKSRRWTRALLIVFVVTWLGSTLAEPAHAQRKRKKLPSQQFKGYGLPQAVLEPPRDLPNVAPVDSSRTNECRQVATKIDELVEAKLVEEGLEPNPLADDATFVRRVYLDGVGTIPTLQQTVAFTEARGVRKQQEIVDELLSSYGYVSHLYNFWASILRVVDKPSNTLFTHAYRDYIQEQLAKNRPFDEWVYEMLTAEGKPWENPAACYTLRDNGMPLVHVDNTVRVFLGTQIGCAQCHDHPFDKWTQQDFYRLAAFVNGTQTRDGKGSEVFAKGNPIARLKEEFKQQDPDKRLDGTANLVAQANMFRVSFDSKKKLRLPHDYQYDDAKPKQVVKPSVLWGEIPAEAATASPREQFAHWLTDKSNPLFAKTLANRLWKKVMGVGLIEPVDNLHDDSPCQNSELLEFLTAELIRLDFNQKEFLRTLMYTRTYQRSSSDYDPSLAEFYHYPGPRLRRMTAEQVWDSILTIAIANPHAVKRPDAKQMESVLSIDMGNADAATIERTANEFETKFSRKAINELQKPTWYRREVLARASELPAPLPAEHFIRQFGQGDRETIEGDSTDPTVPQILTMFNGPFTHMMLEKGSVITQNLGHCRSSRDALNVMFLSILNRPPSARDEEIALREMARGDAAMGFGNVVWALINTREFLFVQ